MARLWTRVGLLIGIGAGCSNNLTASDTDDDGRDTADLTDTDTEDTDTEDTDTGTPNTAPSVSDVLVSPIEPIIGEALTCTWVFTDEEQDEDQSLVSWTIDGEVVGDEVRLVEGYRVGDAVRCTVTPHDGREAGEPLFDEAVIGRGPSKRVSLADADAILTGEAAGDYAGRAIDAAGDLNGDGFDDFLVGSFGHDGNGVNAGAAYVIMGSSDGPKSQSLLYSDAILMGEATLDTAAYTLKGAGDVNGDGFDDIMVGAPANMTYESSAAYIVLGSAEGLSSMSLAGADTKVTGFGNRANNAAGDINGDGFDDVLLTYRTSDDRHKVALLYGSAEGIESGGLAGRVDDVTFVGPANVYLYDSTFLVYGEQVSGAGDFNGDGFDDVLIGAGMVTTEQREVVIFYGTVAEFRPYGNSFTSADLTFTGQLKSDMAGQYVSDAGDVNDDGYDDVLIGAPTRSKGLANGGVVYLVLGAPDAEDMSLRDANRTYIGEYEGQQLGRSLSAAGDVDGDGYDDIVLGGIAPYYSVDSNATYLIYGGNQGDMGHMVGNTADVLFSKAAVDLNSLHSVSAAGDVNGDGFADLLFGHYFRDDYQGAVYYFSGANL